jgi:hypothetical protein
VLYDIGNVPPDPLVIRAQDIQAAMELAGNVVNTDNMDADVMEEIAYNELIDDDVVDLGSTVSPSASAFNMLMIVKAIKLMICDNICVYHMDGIVVNLL